MRWRRRSFSDCALLLLMAFFVVGFPFWVLPAAWSDCRGSGFVSRPRSQEFVPQAFRPSRRANQGERLFHPIIQTAAIKYQVDPALVHAIILAESGYDPRAVSKRGAKGLMQLMPSTAVALGVRDIFDPEHNVNGGVKYLRHLLDQCGGDLHLALAAYHAGMRKVKKYRGIPPFRTTRSYVRKVFQYYRYFKERMGLQSRPS